MSRVILPLALLMALVGPSGCMDPPGPRRSQAAVRDSAGITVVSYQRLEPASVMTLSAVPSMDIGALDGDDVDQLFQVRGAVRMADGRIAVANSGTQEIRFYSAEGEWLASQGGMGDGPGEYRSTAAIFLGRSDSLVVWDDQLRRITVVDPSGAAARSISLEGRDAILPELAGAFGDGSFLLADHRLTDVAPGDWSQVMSRFLRLRADGSVADTVGMFPWMMIRTTVLDGGGMEAMRQTLDQPTRRSVSGSTLWVGTGRAERIERRSESGALQLAVTWTGADRTVTEAHKAAVLEERLAAAPNDDVRRAIETSFQVVPFAEALPAYEDLLATPDGGVWVGAYPEPGTRGPRRWWVFGPDGQLRHAIDIAPDTQVLWVGEDEVGVLEDDDLEVEHVRVYGWG